jgi:hypothetical protein
MSCQRITKHWRAREEPTERGSVVDTLSKGLIAITEVFSDPSEGSLWAFIALRIILLK